MNTFRFDSPSQGWLSADSRLFSSVAASGSPNADVQQLAGDVARLARADAQGAADITRDFAAATTVDESADFANAVTSHLDDGALGALARDSAGREFVSLLQRLVSAGSLTAAQHAQIDRLAAAQFVSTQAPERFALASMVLPHTVSSAVGGAAASKNAAARAMTPEEQVKSTFKEQFGAKAANKEEFHAFMRQVYGDNYDAATAEQFRQQALRGDYSFLPEVKFVDAATLQGGKGAYNQAEGVVYVNRDIAANDPALAAQVFVEEAGAHLDARLNTSDTQGDEGELFRRMLSGEQLSTRELAAIRNDNDRGTIVVDGKEVQVEFWFGEDFVDAVGDAAEAVGDAVSDAADAVGSAASDVADYVGDAARDVVYGIGDAFKEVGMGVINAVENLVTAVAVDIIGGFFMNVLQGRFADAFDAVIRGVDKAVFGTAKRLFNAALQGVANFYKAFTHILPDKLGGNLLRGVIDRAADWVRSVGTGIIDVARSVWRLPYEIVGGFLQDIGGTLKCWARGDVGGGFERLGMAFVNPFKEVAGTVVDCGMIVGSKVGNVVSLFDPDRPPSRGLSKAEREYLKSVYGDSLNLEDIRIHRGDISHKLGAEAPHTVGNDVYIPDEAKYWNADGTLTQEGRLLLVHEAAHVYQAQKGGNDYIHDALLAQIDGEMKAGNRNAGYDFEDVLKSGKPFSEWNPEQQAEFIETMARARDARFATPRDVNGDGTMDTSYDFDGDGRIDADELARAFYDQDGDGAADRGKTAFTFSDADMQRAYEIWDSLSRNRPDRTLVA